jgi:hypothetical protein
MRGIRMVLLRMKIESLQNQIGLTMNKINNPLKVFAEGIEKVVLRSRVEGLQKQIDLTMNKINNPLKIYAEEIKKDLQVYKLEWGVLNREMEKLERKLDGITKKGKYKREFKGGELNIESKSDKEMLVCDACWGEIGVKEDYYSDKNNNRIYCGACWIEYVSDKFISDKFRRTKH